MSLLNLVKLIDQKKLFFFFFLSLFQNTHNFVLLCCWLMSQVKWNFTKNKISLIMQGSPDVTGKFEANFSPKLLAGKNVPCFNVISEIISNSQAFPRFLKEFWTGFIVKRKSWNRSFPSGKYERNRAIIYARVKRSLHDIYL